MKVRHVQCPVCGAILDVPAGLADCFVRCGTCRHRFRLPRLMSVTDDDIAEWLGQAPPADGQPSPAGDAERPGEPAGGLQAAPGEPEEPASAGTAVLPALSGDIRLLRVDDRGATFEFPAARLKETDFRCSMPRRCMRCGRRTHLEAHVVAFAPLLEDSYRFEMEKMAGGRDLPGPDSTRLEGQDLLNVLPPVPGVPPPADLPMPYWLCGLCTGRGLLAGQISINASTGKGMCRLRIKNLRLAEEFLVAAGGGGTDEHAKFAEYVSRQQEQPWDLVPEIVQQRLAEWYSPNRGERFVAYVPDRDVSHIDEGLAGLVVTNRRLIYHGGDRREESLVGERIRLQAPSSTGTVRLRIKTPRWEVGRMALDRNGVDDLRRALTAAQFKAVWY